MLFFNIGLILVPGIKKSFYQARLKFYLWRREANKKAQVGKKKTLKEADS
jgi:hypothetical protein